TKIDRTVTDRKRQGDQETDRTRSGGQELLGLLCNTRLLLSSSPPAIRDRRRSPSSGHGVKRRSRIAGDEEPRRRIARGKEIRSRIARDEEPRRRIARGKEIRSFLVCSATPACSCPHSLQRSVTAAAVRAAD